MPVIAVVNRKGGSGKSTLATHIAAWCAHQGFAVMLGDADRQQSTRTWLRLRNPSEPAIAAWAVDQKNVLRVPSGITHVVLDTPGGLHGFDLAKIVMFADAVLMPVCNSVFDRESAAACFAELQHLPRVLSGRCRLATVGMRVDSRTHAAQTLKEWSEKLPLPYLGALRETQWYVRAVERGLTVFDLPASQGAADVAQWQPILDWLAPVVRPLAAANEATSHAVTSVQRTGSSLDYARPSALMPQQESLVHGGRMAAASARASSIRHMPIAPVLAKAAQRSRSLSDKPAIPEFLRQN